MGSSLSQDAAVPEPNYAEPEAAQPLMKTIPESQNAQTKAMAMATTETTNLPYNCEAIFKDADSPIDNSSPHKLYDQLYAGVFLNQKRKVDVLLTEEKLLFLQKYWIERKSHSNCFFVFARGLSITWAEDSRFWHWPYFKETSDTFIDVAEMINVCWLEVHGKFETAKLTPGVRYEVAFVVMLRDPAYGWEVPVNLRLVLPDRSKQEHKEDMMEKLRGRWIDIPVGEFLVEADKAGVIEYSLYEYEGGVWKRGLVVKGVAIRPKT